MDGQVTQRVNQIDADSRQFELKTGLAGANPDRTTGAVRFLNMGEADLIGMTAEELGVAAVSVANLGFQLQNEYAMWTAEANRFFGAARRMVADVVSSGFVSQDRVLAEIKKNPVALQLDTRAQEAQQKADRLAYLAKQAEFSAQMMMTLSQARRKVSSRSFE